MASHPNCRCHLESGIDIFSDDMISLSEAANHVARIRNKKPNRDLVVRWARRGVHGVKLDVVRIEGALWTSKQALNRFLEKSSRKRRIKQTKEQMSKLARAELEAVERELGV